MSKYDIAADTPQWQALMELFREMESMLSEPRFNMVQFGKAYEMSAQRLLAAVQAQGMSSLRFEAAARALDLKTPKAHLERFLRED